jgi:serine/threonine protein kinase
VAIKELHTQNLSKVAQNELTREAKIMAEMHSDYLVQLRGICMEAPHFCLVMELMPKGSLYDVLRTNPDWSLSVKYRIALDVVSGLAQLHEKNIIHRDLKSLNILLSDSLRAKICDFGLAKVKSEITSTSQSKGMVGTLGWAAPELFDEKPHTKSTDIYAFTMVLWEMMMSPYRTPFQGMTATPLIAAKLSRGDRQETIPGTCPPELSNIIRSGWKKSNERPTAQALVKSLSALFAASERPLTLPREGLLQSSLWTVAPSS